jgi:hypothetical protein
VAGGGPLALASRRPLTAAGLRCAPGAGRLFQAVGVEGGRGRPVREQADDADTLGKYINGNGVQDIAIVGEGIERGLIVEGITIIGARQSLTCRDPIVECCPTNANRRPNRIREEKPLRRIQRSCERRVKGL